MEDNSPGFDPVDENRVEQLEAEIKRLAAQVDALKKFLGLRW